MTSPRPAAKAPASASVLSPLPADTLIGGVWRSGASRFAVTDPADNALIAHVADGDRALAEAAVEAANAAFAKWRHSPARQRALALRAWFDALADAREPLARLITAETGKPMAEALGEVAYAASYVEWFAEEAKRADGEVLALAPEGQHALTLREPVGVVAIVTPWNFPLAMLTRKIAPAIAAGCAVVVKPAEDTPLTALAAAALAEQAGVPPGLINVVPASRPRAQAVVSAWLDDARVRKLSFTGSTEVGKLLAGASARTLKRVSLELGGNAPFLVFDDADIGAAVAALMKAKFRNAGQACIAANRVLIQKAAAAPFIDALIEATRELTVGPASEGAFDVGPLINPAALARVRALVADAVERGARVILGGGPHARGGTFFEPTILLDVPSNARIAREEVFGPVLALSTFADEDEAFALANDTEYGLAAYVCTSNQSRIWRAAAALECGLLGVNEGAISAEFAPFGGVKASGYGREGSKHGLSEYQNLKYVCLRA